MPVISWRELAEKRRSNADRYPYPEEFSFGTIPGAVNIPLDEMRDRLSEIPADKPVVLFCAVGLRGYLAQRILIGRGYRNTANLIGGYKTYSTAVAPIPAPRHHRRLSLLHPLRRNRHRAVLPKTFEG